MLDSLDEPALRQALPSLFAALDAIHDIEPPGDGYGLWIAGQGAPHASWRDFLLSITEERARLSGWRAALESSPSGAARFDEAVTALDHLARVLPDERHVVHSDLLHNNVLLSGDRLSAVIDWGNALYGDWLCDAAWLIYFWSWYPAWSGIDIRHELEQHWAATIGLPANLDQRLLCYQIHIGLYDQAYNAFIGRWDLLEANARLTAELVRNAGISGI